MTGGRIDVHAHYVGGVIGRRSAGATLRGGDPVPRWTVADAYEFMDRFDISTQILSVPGEILGVPENDHEAREHRRIVRTVNEEYAALITDHPGRFGAFASLPLDSTDACLEELTHALDELGLDGVLLPSNFRGRYLGDAWYEPIFAELSARDVPIFLHPVEPPNISAVAPDRPSWITELPFETARTVSDALFRGTFRRHADLTIVLAHCGGALPTLAERLAEHAGLSNGGHDAIGRRDDPSVSPQDVRTALGRLYFDTAIAGSAHSVLPALEVGGPGHIVFGTDWPAVPWHTVDEADRRLELLTRTTPLELDAIHRRNAASLFPRLR